MTKDSRKFEATEAIFMWPDSIGVDITEELASLDPDALVGHGDSGKAKKEKDDKGPKTDQASNG